jgi:hypothetical protein
LYCPSNHPSLAQQYLPILKKTTTLHLIAQTGNAILSP